eukprot:5440950-Prymnesium_polylepis.1
MMRAQVDHAPSRRRRLDSACERAGAPRRCECSISMHRPAAMILATRIAPKRSASTHMRAHNRG